MIFLPLNRTLVSLYINWYMDIGYSPFETPIDSPELILIMYWILSFPCIGYDLCRYFLTQMMALLCSEDLIMLILNDVLNHHINQEWSWSCKKCKKRLWIVEYFKNILKIIENPSPNYIFCFLNLNHINENLVVIRGVGLWGSPRLSTPPTPQKSEMVKYFACDPHP